MRLTTLLMVGAAFGVGVYVGIELAKAHARGKISGAAKSALSRIGIDPKSSYGEAAGTIVDTVVGGIVN